MSDRGSSSVEFAILAPILLVLVFAVPQFGMWYHARQVAQGASQVGVRASSVDRAQPGAGSEAAESYLNTVGAGTVTSSSVSEENTAEAASVRVRAQVPRVIPLPGLNFSVEVVATRARERFTTPGVQ